jgi:hypothetical protein
MSFAEDNGDVPTTVDPLLVPPGVVDVPEPVPVVVDVPEPVPVVVDVFCLTLL